MNLQTLIEQAKNEMDEQLLTNPAFKISLISGDEKRAIMSFLEKQMRELAINQRRDAFEELIRFLEYKQKKFGSPNTGTITQLASEIGFMAAITVAKDFLTTLE